MPQVYERPFSFLWEEYRLIRSKSIVDQIPSLSTTSSSLNSLFRVLFIFPSRYLFAIGLSSIFSLRWSIPPILCCTLKQHDSLTQMLSMYKNNHAYGSLTLYAVLFQVNFRAIIIILTHSGIHYNFVPHFRNTNSRLGLFSFSFAITKEIIVIFFSSTY